MTERTDGDGVDTERAWLRLGCPVCGGWLAVPGDVPEGVHAERVARRIDSFVYRHAACAGRDAPR